jgi:hypothetical protein
MMRFNSFNGVWSHIFKTNFYYRYLLMTKTKIANFFVAFVKVTTQFRIQIRFQIHELRIRIRQEVSDPRG